jgi:GAF domain-containing protein
MTSSGRRSYRHSVAIGRRLTHSLDFDATLEHVAQLPIPVLADWCVVYTPEDGDVRPRRILAAHRDPAQQARLRSAWPSDRVSLPREHPLQISLRSRQPVILEACTTQEITSMCVSPGDLEMLLEVKPRTVVATPMVAHGLVVGALMLVSYSARRPTLSGAYMDAVTALANCSAQAIYNAQLFWEARLAARTRDEVASVGRRELLHLASGLQQRLTTLRSRLSVTESGSSEQFDRGLTDIEDLATAIGERLSELRAVAGEYRRT